LCSRSPGGRIHALQVCWGVEHGLGSDAPRFPLHRGTGDTRVVVGRPESAGGLLPRWGTIGHHALARRGAEPARDVRPQARCPRRGPRAVPLDRDGRPGSEDLRAPPPARRADGPAYPDPVAAPRLRPDPRDRPPAPPDGPGLPRRHGGTALRFGRRPAARRPKRPPSVRRPPPAGRQHRGRGAARPVGRPPGNGL
jgi:hypothetical protein